MIQKAKFKEGYQLSETRFAPYADYDVWIIDKEILIFPEFDESIIQDFDVYHNSDMFDIIETVNPDYDENRGEGTDELK